LKRIETWIIEAWLKAARALWVDCTAKWALEVSWIAL
jgi:hypothetical protein